MPRQPEATPGAGYRAVSIALFLCLFDGPAGADHDGARSFPSRFQVRPPVRRSRRSAELIYARRGGCAQIGVGAVLPSASPVRGAGACEQSLLCATEKKVASGREGMDAATALACSRPEFARDPAGSRGEYLFVPASEKFSDYRGACLVLPPDLERRLRAAARPLAGARMWRRASSRREQRLPERVGALGVVGPALDVECEDRGLAEDASGFDSLSLVRVRNASTTSAGAAPRQTGPAVQRSHGRGRGMRYRR